MSHPNLSIVPPSPTRLEALFADRTRLASEGQRLGEIAARLRAAEDCERESLAAIADFGAGEVAAITTWAAAGGSGPMPTPDLDKRRDLADKLVAAQALAEAVRGAGVDIEAKQRVIAEQVAKIDRDIAIAAGHELASRAQREVAKINSLAEQVAEHAANFGGARTTLSEIGRSYSDRGDAETGRVFFTMATSLEGAAADAFDPDPTRIKAAIEQQGAVFVALSKGEQP